MTIKSIGVFEVKISFTSGIL